MNIVYNTGFPAEKGEKLSTLRRKITQDDIDKYSNCSGDHNPLHTSPEYAAGTRFGSTIAHGMLVLKLVEDMMLNNFGRKWLDGGGLEVRFKQPVYPGDTVEVEGFVNNTLNLTGTHRISCDIRVLKKANEIVLSGTAWLNIRKE